MHGSVATVAHKQTCWMFIASSVTLWQVLISAEIAKNALNQDDQQLIRHAEHQISCQIFHEKKEKPRNKQ